MHCQSQPNSKGPNQWHAGIKHIITLKAAMGQEPHGEDSDGGPYMPCKIYLKMSQGGLLTQNTSLPNEKVPMKW